jgi:hypothetical protein
LSSNRISSSSPPLKETSKIQNIFFQNFRKDVRLPVQLQRAMAAEAEAAREARAKVNKKYDWSTIQFRENQGLYYPNITFLSYQVNIILFSGHSGWGRAEGLEGFERGRRRHIAKPIGLTGLYF